MDVNGSLEYVLTWKEQDMPAGLPICALRASARPIQDKGFAGWLTPNTPSGGPNTKSTPKHTGGMDLEGAASLCGWCSPTAQDGSRGDKDPRPHDTGIPLSQQAVLAGWATPDASAMNLGEGLETWDARQVKNKAKHKNGNGAGMPLQVQALTVLAGWATPRAEDAESAGMRHSRGVADTLSAQAGQDLAGNPSSSQPTVMKTETAQTAESTSPTADASDQPRTGLNTRSETKFCLAGWCSPASRDWKDSPGMATTGINPDGTTRDRIDQLPRQAAQALGTDTTSSPAGTEKRGALNPAHSRWLMGFPVVWDSCGATAMQSCRKSRRSSSTPQSKP
jgi:hypothetical protein